MSGFNMPPGVSPGDIPGNDVQSVDADRLIALLLTTLSEASEAIRNGCRTRSERTEAVRRIQRVITEVEYAGYDYQI